MPRPRQNLFASQALLGCFAGAAALGGVGFLAGCADRTTRPMTSEAFYHRIPEAPESSIDQPGALYRPREGGAAPEPQPPVHEVPKIVSDTVDARQAVDEAATSRPATRAVAATHPATAPGDTLGTYLTIGGVLAEVNGKAIYADKVFAAIDKALRAKAAEQAEEQFRVTAQKLVDDEVKTEINEELVYAAAQRALSPEEKALADNATERWRQQQITEAGGSLELARRKAQANGDDFDELVSNQGKKMLIRLYYTKKVYPRVQVTADEMRRYYERNRDALFTEHAAARFRLIKIEPERTGGREKALDKIKDIRRRALAGEDFAQLAKDFNDDLALKRSGGLIGNGWIDKGAFKLEDVENAVWKLQPYQLTDIIDSHGAFYLAYLEDVKRGKVMPFESQQVQQQIRETLSAAELRELREQVQDRLMQHAVVNYNPNMMDIALEMAMQRYVRWTK
jgi:hypothetical protein